MFIFIIFLIFYIPKIMLTIKKSIHSYQNTHNSYIGLDKPKNYECRNKLNILCFIYLTLFLVLMRPIDLQTLPAAKGMHIMKKQVQHLEGKSPGSHRL